MISNNVSNLVEISQSEEDIDGEAVGVNGEEAVGVDGEAGVDVDVIQP